MRPKFSTPDTPSERLVREIRRATRKQYSAEEKIHIVLDGLRSEATIAELCRREGIATASGCDQARVVHKPRLLSDNGSSYVSADLAEWLDDNSMNHVRGAPHHLQTQGKKATSHSQTLVPSP